MSKYCPKCGEKLIGGDKFCRNCGESLDNMSKSWQNFNNFQTSKVEKSHTATILIGYILALLLPVFAVIVSLYLLTRSSSKAKKHGKSILIVSVIVLFLTFLFSYFSVLRYIW